MTADGRIKPDVMAMGGGASVINISGNSEFRSGTSYASPIVCGLVACLWQANPKLSNYDLLDIIRKSANQAGKEHRVIEKPTTGNLLDLESILH